MHSHVSCSVQPVVGRETPMDMELKHIVRYALVHISDVPMADQMANGSDEKIGNRTVRLHNLYDMFLFGNKRRPGRKLRLAGPS